jgi:MoaA/NifB/PqqE/SkfB family radical SAM enzyme
MADMTVANTILEQLGGRRFRAMTGAKDFMGGERSLSFKLPARFAKDGINAVQVTLDASDTYSVGFFRVRGTAIKLVAKMDDVYADALAGVFTKVTGLDTRL